MPFPIVAEVEVTDRCNLHCSHCPYADAGEGDYLRAVSSAVIDILADEQVRHIGLDGGEPLLAPGALRELVGRCAARSFKTVVLTTNATLVDAGTADFLAQHRVTARVEIFGSRPEVHDAVTGVPGSWQETVDGLRTLSAHRVFVVGYVPLLPTNAGDCREVCRLLKDLGVSVVNFSTVPTIAWTPARYRSALGDAMASAEEFDLRLLSDLPLMASISEVHGGVCPSGRLSFFVASDGTVYPCRFIRMPCGNILEDSPGAVWSHPVLSEVAAVPEDCRGCRWAARCAGGCRAAALRQLGSLALRDPGCFLAEG